jgi:hypothetical protein
MRVSVQGGNRVTQQDVTFGAVPIQPAGTKPTKPGWWTRVQAWDNRLSVAKGLTLVTLLTGFFGGYFQYLNAYQENVSALAKSDMAAATSTFVDISNAFSEAQMLQELIFYNFTAYLTAGADLGDKGMVTEAGNDIFPAYMKARSGLRQNSSVFAHKAEIYIDWASDLGRDPAAPRVLDVDPLTEALLGDYNFNCDAEANLPQLAASGSAAPQASPATCAGGAQPAVASQTINLCARDRGGKIVAGKPPVTIDWQSAKHHVMTLHYCFEQAHRQIVTARIWASKNTVSDERAKQFQDNVDRYNASLDRQVVRLNAFMSLTMAHLERIRIKYRPTSFSCHVPLLRDAIGLFSTRCTPLRTG